MLDAAFVFVVCGSKEHIETLDFSYKELKKRTRFPIYIITDSTRNQVPIEFENCIDIEVNKELTNHQASIFLKTSLHRYLPFHEKYCYLDTDVIACGAQPDQIFYEYIAPIRFALDHCTIQKFSPTAIHCNCDKNKSKEQYLWKELMKQNSLLMQYHEKLNKDLNGRKKTFIEKWILLFDYYTSFPKFKLNEKFYFDKRSRKWFHHEFGEISWELDWGGESITDKYGTEIRFDKVSKSWINKSGQNIWDDSCRCLENQIRTDLNINVANENWHHWNGGVFLFSQNSTSFLDDWHKLTLNTFNLPNWKTRDQGSLIATVWKHELQDRIPLDTKWNFLVDANNEAIVFNEDGIGSIDGGRHTFKTEFAHIYHRFGDTTWPIWQNVVKLLNNG
jgi:hypothetical protein